MKELNVVIDEQNQDESDSMNLEKLNVPWYKKLIIALEVQHKGNLSLSQMYLYNYDLRPVEEARRTWKWYNYVFFWISDSFNINTWQIASTGIQLGGMNWWQTWISVWLGYFLCGVFVSIGSRVGIYYHISFPVVARSSFGIYGSIWPVLNRVVMSCIWYSVQCSVAGPCFEVMLRAIFSQNLDKTMPDGIRDPDLSTYKFLCFFLFWLFSLPFIWLPPHKVKHLFTVKAYVAPVAGVAFLVWTLVKAGGGGPVISQPAKVHGGALGWAFVESTMASLANFATLIVNAPDFSRMANKPSFAMNYLVFTLSIPICFSFTSLIGILVTSASEVMYHETYWSPLDVLGRFLDDYTSGNRTGVFFLGLAFALAQLGTNISANSLSFGTDVTALMPRFMNIRRGGYICAMLALCICPWKLTSSSSMFTTYLSAYAVFLSAIAGVIACDYYYVRRGYIELHDLFSLTSNSKTGNSLYKFNIIGCNWRAYAAYISGILPNIVGFVGATKTHEVPIGATYVYRLNFFSGFIASAVVYGILCRFFPIEGVPQVGSFDNGWFEQYQYVEDFESEMQNSDEVSITYEVSYEYDDKGKEFEDGNKTCKLT